MKIGSDLYKTVMPMVKQQVESQIKVRDLSAAKLEIEPADATSWNDVRTELIAEKKALLRSELETELSAAADEAAIDKLRTEFSRKERMLENQVDSQVSNLLLRSNSNSLPSHARSTHPPSDRPRRVLAASSPSRVAVVGRSGARAAWDRRGVPMRHGAGPGGQWGGPGAHRSRRAGRKLVS